MKLSRHLFPILLCLALLPLLARAAAPPSEYAPVRKKLIATGWDNPDPARLRQNLEQMEQRPFDGVVIQMEGRIDSQKRCPLSVTFTADPWQREWFTPGVADLKACPFKRFTDNFLLVGANPGSVDWFDDAGWRQIVEHMRIAAGIARQSKLKGLLFDPEPYSQPFAQFNYRAQAGREKHSFAEYCVKARQRGREVMQAVAAEYPSITIFCYFMNAVNASAAGSSDLTAALENLGYGLYPAFIDGWLDAIPPTVTLVDGCEMGYRFNSELEYLENGLAIRNSCQGLVSRVNRAKYRAQVQASFGIYLDAYWNPTGSPWFIDGKGGSRVERLRVNTATALRVADEYVWVYGEQFRWWPTPNGSVHKESWPEALPGSEQALRYARDPVDFARSRIAELAKEGKLVNLARNGAFDSTKVTTSNGATVEWKSGPPVGWGTWQEEKSKGGFKWDRESSSTGKGTACASGVANGCFIQSYEVKPGDRFAVSAMRKLQGRGSACLYVRWQTAESKWTLQDRDRIFLAAGAADQWSEIFGVVEIPPAAGKLVLLLSVSGQESADDLAWFDDVRVWRLE